MAPYCFTDTPAYFASYPFFAATCLRVLWQTAEGCSAGFLLEASWFVTATPYWSLEFMAFWEDCLLCPSLVGARCRKKKPVRVIKMKKIELGCKNGTRASRKANTACYCTLFLKTWLLRFSESLLGITPQTGERIIPEGIVWYITQQMSRASKKKTLLKTSKITDN